MEEKVLKKDDIKEKEVKEMEESKDIVPIEAEVLPYSMEEVKDIGKIIDTAERIVEKMKKVLSVAIQRTRPKDWVSINDQPYLTSRGAEKIMSLFGIKIYDVSSEKIWSEDEKGEKYYIWVFKGKGKWAGGEIECIGTRSSRDKMFGWDSKEKVFKPLSEVDEANIMKGAYTNFEVNVITRLLGIKSLDWEDLEKLGIKKNDVSRVEFKKGGKEEKGVKETCENCGKEVSPSVAKFSKEKFSKVLCFECQKDLK